MKFNVEKIESQDLAGAAGPPNQKPSLPALKPDHGQADARISSDGPSRN